MDRDRKARIKAVVSSGLTSKLESLTDSEKLELKGIIERIMGKYVGLAKSDHASAVTEISRDVMTMINKKFPNLVQDYVDLLNMEEVDPEIHAKVVALFGERKYKELCDFITPGLINKIPSKDRMFFLGLSYDAFMLHRQRETGKGYQLSFTTCPGRQLDRMEEYIKGVAIADIPGKNRGVIATRDFAAGEIISATKAMFLCRSETDEAVSRERLTQAMVQNVHDVLQEDKALRGYFYTLWAGPELGYLIYDPNKKYKLEVDRIAGICEYNMTYVSKTQMADQVSHVNLAGIWYIQAFLNHSCWDCNACIRTFEDTLFIHSIKPIKKGEEVTVSYLTSSMPWPARDVYLKTLGFTCYCSLCELEREEIGVFHDEREELLQRFWEYSRSNAAPEIMESIVYRIDRLRVGDKAEFNMCLIDALNAMAMTFHKAAYCHSIIPCRNEEKKTKLEIEREDLVYKYRMREMKCWDRCYALAFKSPFIQVAVDVAMQALMGAILYDLKSTTHRYWAMRFHKAATKCHENLYTTDQYIDLSLSTFRGFWSLEDLENTRKDVRLVLNRISIKY